MARACGVPIAGRDLKTGQTLYKAVLAGMLRDRLLGVRGWFSLNLLGNDDGRTLTEPGPLAEKARSKSAALDALLDGQRWPELYGELEHVVRIEHFGPRGDDKEAWDTIEIEGFLGLPMQLKVNLLGRDSILAAPLVIDVARLLDLAAQGGVAGPVEALGYYFKDPIGAKAAADHRPEVQRARLNAFVASLS